MKDAALGILLSNDLNYADCCEKLGISAGVLLELRHRFRREFDEVDAMFFLGLEGTLYKIATGRSGLDKEQIPQVKQTIQWILERRVARWNKSNKVEMTTKNVRLTDIPVNSTAGKLVEDYERRNQALTLPGPDDTGGGDS